MAPDTVYNKPTSFLLHQPSETQSILFFTDLIEEIITEWSGPSLPGPPDPPADLLCQNHRMRQQSSSPPSQPLLLARGTACQVRVGKNTSSGGSSRCDDCVPFVVICVFCVHVFSHLVSLCQKFPRLLLTVIPRVRPWLHILALISNVNIYCHCNHLRILRPSTSLSL